MSSLIQRTLSLAQKTFSKLSTQNRLTHEELSPLISLLAEVRAKTIDFDENLVSENYLGDAPSTYIGIHEDSVVSMGVFVIRDKEGIPLHNHPRMYGVCKVIHGKVAVRSYDLVEDEEKVKAPTTKIPIRPVGQRKETVLSSDDGCCVLTPEEGNIHEIRPVDGPAAFLDILAPPYDHDTGARICQYYKTVDLAPSNGIEWLLKVAPPREFWCDTAEYRGPKISEWHCQFLCRYSITDARIYFHKTEHHAEFYWS